ncbi:cell envelope integrity EipB family protein [Methylocella sp.]|uniref:cell envelope integrity EipB family protein n=1 Tax=Methylocella sp. TaxID=1978226 RepID=UPI0035B345A8
MQLKSARLSPYLVAACLVGLCADPGAADGVKPGPASMDRLGGRPEPDVTLTPHRAVYELSLAKSVGAKSPTAAHGRIAFDFSGSACDGYVQNFRQMTELQPAEGPTRVSDMLSSTFEDGAGSSFDFKMQTRVDNDAAETVDGKAVKSRAGPIQVSLAKPKRDKLELGEDVVFPTEHLKRIIAAAEAGQSVLELKVFDGSDTGEKLFETTTYIGRPTTAPAEDKAAQIPELAGMTRWPVSISYFEADRKDDGPSYVLAFDLYQNGVSRALKLDYGDFVLSGALSSLEIASAPPCAR